MDKSARFEVELLALQPSLERFALSLTVDHDDAIDLVQETLLKALGYKDMYESDTNLKAWVFTIMRNTFVNNYRKSIKQQNLLEDTANQQLISNISTAADITNNEIGKKINELDPELRIPFQMHILGYNYKEIAEKLNLKIGTVKSRIFFSRQKLMSLLKDH